MGKLACNHCVSERLVLVMRLSADLKCASNKSRAGLSLLLLLFFDPGTQFPRKENENGMKTVTLRNTKKYGNEAGATVDRRTYQYGVEVTTVRVVR